MLYQVDIYRRVVGSQFLGAETLEYDASRSYSGTVLYKNPRWYQQHFSELRVTVTDGKPDGRCTRVFKGGNVHSDGFIRDGYYVGEYIYYKKRDGVKSIHCFLLPDGGEALDLMFQPPLSAEDKFELTLKYGCGDWL